MPAMSKMSFIIGIFGIPLIAPFVLFALLTPRYVPSEQLKKAADSSADPRLVRQRIVRSFVGRCARDWNLDPDALDGMKSLYSWENNAGLVARTDIICAPQGPCTVSASALVHWPLPTHVSGKPLPTRIWGCRPGVR